MSGRTLLYLMYGIGLIVNAILMFFRPDFRVSPIAVLVAGILMIFNVVRVKV